MNQRIEDASDRTQDQEQETLPSFRFRTELERLINRHLKESGSNTPDFILAGYLIDCLDAYDRAVIAREKWYRSPHDT
jgi:hypothetical protein